MESEIINFVERFGLPTVMCLWFMFRTEKVINRNTEAWIAVKGMISKR